MFLNVRGILWTQHGDIHAEPPGLWLGVEISSEDVDAEQAREQRAC